MRVMLLTKANRKALPALHAQDGKGEDATVYVKFFTPDANLTWYATEFDGEDTFFGLCDLGPGFGGPEWGYFSLAELQTVRGKYGLPVERDRHYGQYPVWEMREGGRAA